MRLTQPNHLFRRAGALNLIWALSIFCTVGLVCASPRSANAQDEPPTEVTPAEIPPAEVTPATPAPEQIEIAAIGADEAEALNRLGNAKSWPQRALAVMRLERFDCEASAGRLLAMAGDSSWRVRAYAFACLARRGIAVAPERLEQEADPRVLRAILRATDWIYRNRAQAADAVKLSLAANLPAPKTRQGVKPKPHPNANTHQPALPNQPAQD